MDLKQLLKCFSDGELRELRGLIFDEQKSRFAFNLPEPTKEETDTFRHSQVEAIKTYRQRLENSGCMVPGLAESKWMLEDRAKFNYPPMSVEQPNYVLAANCLPLDERE